MLFRIPVYSQESKESKGGTISRGGGHPAISQEKVLSFTEMVMYYNSADHKII